MFNKVPTLISVVAVLFVGQVFGAVLIAGPGPVSVCSPPKTAGSSCRFYSGPSENDPIVNGVCVDQGGVLTCVTK